MVPRTTHAARNILVVATLGIALAFLAGGCEKKAPRPPLTDLRILYTTDTRGHIEPCGCSSGQAGSISRRMTYLRDASTEFSLLVDAGDVTAGPRDWEFFELTYLLKGYDKMGYDGVNAGHREASLDVARLRQLADEFDFLVSANLCDDSGKTIFPPYRIVNLPGGQRAGIFGVMSETLPPGALGAGVSVQPAMDAVGKILPALNDKSDIILALVFADEDIMRALAERFYEIDIIVGGDVVQPIRTPVQANRSLMVAITDKGKAIGQLDLKFANGKIESSKNDIHMLMDTMAEDPDVLKIVTEFKNNLEKMNFQPHRDDEEGLTTITSARSASADRYVAAQNCKQCHPKAVEIWEKSKHSHAYESIVQRGHAFNPRCIECHSVGYGASDGFVSKQATPEFAAVSCGNCHGRGEFHMKERLGEDIPSKSMLVRNTDCTRCHDPENSPKFNRESYWELIKHGLE